MRGYYFFRKIRCLYVYRIARTVLSYLNAEKYLEWRSHDWIIQKSAFGRGRQCEFRYQVTAYNDFARGTGLGKTAMQAAKRSIKQIVRERKKRKLVIVKILN